MFRKFYNLLNYPPLQMILSASFKRFVTSYIIHKYPYSLLKKWINVKLHGFMEHHVGYPTVTTVASCVTDFLRAKPRTETHSSTGVNQWMNGAWVKKRLNSLTCCLAFQSSFHLCAFLYKFANSMSYAVAPYAFP